MTGSYIPNSFQNPNALVDEMMHLLTDSELRVMLFAVRHIYGWQDRISSRRARISLSMFERGFTTKDGRHYNGCGLARKAIIDALNQLVGFGALVKVGEPTPTGQEWEIGEVPDMGKLAQRQSEQAQKRAEKTAAARAKKQASAEGGLSDTPAEVVCATNQEAVSPTNRQVVSTTNQQWLVPQTGGGLSHTPNQTQAKTQKQTQEDKPTTLRERAREATAGVGLIPTPSPVMQKSLQEEQPAGWTAALAIAEAKAKSGGLYAGDVEAYARGVLLNQAARRQFGQAHESKAIAQHAGLSPDFELTVVE